MCLPSFQRLAMENDILVAYCDGPLPALLADSALFAGGRLHYLVFLEVCGTLNTLSYCLVPFTFRYFHIVK